MAKWKLKPEFVAIIVFALVVSGIFVGLRRRTPRPPPGHKLHQHDFFIETLDQEAAYPGKLIRISKSRGDVVRYTCRPNDAAIVVARIQTEDGAEYGDIQSEIQSTAGCPFSVIQQRFGDYWVFALQRGFAAAPPKLELALFLKADGKRTPNAFIEFTRIAQPVRNLTANGAGISTGTGNRRRATFNQNRSLSVSRAEQLPPGEFEATDVLQTSFSAPGGEAATESPLDNETVQSYARFTDAVRVRISRRRDVYDEVTLVYQNAKVLDGDRGRILWLPFTQKIGSLLGSDAVLEKFSGNLTANAASAPSRSTSLLNIRMANANYLDRLMEPFNPTFGGRRREVKPVNFLSISPTLEAMGVPRIRLTITTLLIDKELTAIGPLSKNPLTEIPKLELRFRVRRTETISSETMVLPVSHVATEASLKLH